MDRIEVKGRRVIVHGRAQTTTYSYDLHEEAIAKAVELEEELAEREKARKALAEKYNPTPEQKKVKAAPKAPPAAPAVETSNHPEESPTDATEAPEAPPAPPVADSPAITASISYDADAGAAVVSLVSNTPEDHVVVRQMPDRTGEIKLAAGREITRPYKLASGQSMSLYLAPRDDNSEPIATLTAP